MTSATSQKKRQAFIESAQNSIEGFERTGIAYGHKDVKRWFLAKLEGKKARKPKATRVPSSRR